MPQSLSKIWTHLIFSTKERFPFLSDETVRHDMHAYMASVLTANHCPTLQVGGVSDHVHSLFVLSKNHLTPFSNPFRVRKVSFGVSVSRRVTPG